MERHDYTLWPGKSRKVHPWAICPPEENPLSFWHMTGWKFLSYHLWSNEAIYNPITYYFFGRLKRMWAEDLFGLAPWIVVLILDSVGFVSLIIWQRPELLFLSLCLQIASMGLLGLWIQIMVHRSYRRLALGNLYDQIYTTRITPAEYVAGFTLRPLTNQAAMLVFATIAEFAVLICWSAYRFVAFGDFFPIVAVPLAAALIFRFIYLRVALEYPATLAIRALLFIPRTGEAYVRMIRDWIFPWGLLPGLIAAFVVAGCALLMLILGGAAMIFLAVFVLIGVWMLTIGPSMILESAADEMFWFLRSSEQWHLRTGERSPEAPRSLLKRWRLHTGASS